MKKFNKKLVIKSTIWIIALLLSVVVSSCKDDSLDITNSLSDKGGFVRFENENPPSSLGVDEIANLNYSFTVIDGNDNIDFYDLKLYAVLGGVATDTVDVARVTTFPASFDLDAQDFADFLNIEISDINFGDSFFFLGTAMTDEGLVYSGEATSYDNLEDDDPQTFIIDGGGLSPDLLSEEGYKQAFAFDFIILCPSADVNELIGTFDVINHRFDAFFGSQGTTREIVAGPEDNQITIVGGAVPLDGADDLILTINADNSMVSYGGEEGKIHFNTFGPGSYASVSGLVFSCVGVIDITIESDGFIPNFLTLTKQ